MITQIYCYFPYDTPISLKYGQGKAYLNERSWNCMSYKKKLLYCQTIEVGEKQGSVLLLQPICPMPYQFNLLSSSSSCFLPPLSFLPCSFLLLSNFLPPSTTFLHSSFQPFLHLNSSGRDHNPFHYLCARISPI